jgi:hypothetical protein
MAHTEQEMVDTAGEHSEDFNYDRLNDEDSIELNLGNAMATPRIFPAFKLGAVAWVYSVVHLVSLIAIAIVLRSKTDALDTYTCNLAADKSYACEVRGAFSPSSMLVFESSMAMVFGCCFAYWSRALSLNFNLMYNYLRVAFTASSAFLAMVLCTSVGLRMQSTYVYTLLSLLSLGFYPMFETKYWIAPMLLALVGCLGCLLPLCTLLFTPAGVTDLSHTQVASSLLHIFYVFFIGWWWMVVKYFNLNCFFDIVVFTLMSFHYIILMRVILTIDIYNLIEVSQT